MVHLISQTEQVFFTHTGCCDESWRCVFCKLFIFLCYTLLFCTVLCQETIGANHHFMLSSWFYFYSYCCIINTTVFSDYFQCCSAKWKGFIGFVFINHHDLWLMCRQYEYDTNACYSIIFVVICWSRWKQIQFSRLRLVLWRDDVSTFWFVRQNVHVPCNFLDAYINEVESLFRPTAGSPLTKFRSWAFVSFCPKTMLLCSWCQGYELLKERLSNQVYI